MRESIIEAYLCKKAKEAGGECRKVKWVNRKGAPDRLVMLPEYRLPRGILRISQTIWVELKATGKKPEPHQVREHNRMRKMGQRVEVIDSLEAVDRLFA